MGGREEEREEKIGGREGRRERKESQSIKNRTEIQSYRREKGRKRKEGGKEGGRGGEKRGREGRRERKESQSVYKKNEQKFKATGPKNVLVEPPKIENNLVYVTTGVIRNLPLYKEERSW